MINLEIGNVAVPFQKRRRAARQMPREGKKFPDFRRDEIIVCVNNMIAAMTMTGDVHLNNAFVRNLPDILLRVKIVIECRNIDIVHIEQKPAAGFFRHIAQKIPFVDSGLFEAQISARIFKNHGTFQKILYLFDASADVL